MKRKGVRGNQNLVKKLGNPFETSDYDTVAQPQVSLKGPPQQQIDFESSDIKYNDQAVSKLMGH